MKLTGNTVLVTGGSSGIGLAIEFAVRGNKVVVTGRDKKKLEQLAATEPQLHVIQSDVSDPESVARLYEQVVRDFPALNILINNAGIMRKINLQDGDVDLADITREIETNLMGSIRMSKQFFAHLRSQPGAAIVNVSSGIAFSPFPISPIYSAAKAGLRAFTRSLRVQLKNTQVHVIELAPPLTNTALGDPFDAADIKGIPPLDPKQVATALMKGLEKNRSEVKPGLTWLIELGSRIAPDVMVKAASGTVDALLANTKP